MGDVSEALRQAIARAIDGAEIDVVSNGGGHYALVVRSSSFEGRGMVECHRMVLAAIAPLMAGDNAPVHAIDSLRTRVP